MSTTLHPVDMAGEAFLSGRFAPVTTEITADHLAVEGTLPPDLTGHYVRNGPNPEFVPLGSYTYPLEGDGLVHRVWLEGGAARYANRWVRTNGLKAEERAGHAPYGGLMSPAFVDTSLLGDDLDEADGSTTRAALGPQVRLLMIFRIRRCADVRG